MIEKDLQLQLLFENQKINTFFLSLKEIRENLLSINFLKINGKTFINELLLDIKVIDLIDFIILPSIYEIDISEEDIQLNFNINKVIEKMCDKCIFYLLNKNIVNFSYIKLFKAFGYILTYLKNFINFENKYNNLDIKEILKLYVRNIPLCIPANPYIKLEKSNFYIGGYYNLYNKVFLFKYKRNLLKNIEINFFLLDNIHKLQNMKYCLVKKDYMVRFIKVLEKFLTFDKIKNNKNLIENWYVCYQYLNYLDNNIDNIYFVYTIDFRGCFYNITNGLNPTKNELSRYLLNFGSIQLDEKTKYILKKYICDKLKIDFLYFDKFFINLNLNFEDIETFQFLMESYSIEQIMLLLDWKYNVIERNETEILLEYNIFKDLNYKILFTLFSEEKDINININFVDIIYSNIKVELLKKNYFFKELEYVLFDIIEKIPFGITYYTKKNIFINFFDKIINFDNLLKMLHFLKNKKLYKNIMQFYMDFNKSNKDNRYKFFEEFEKIKVKYIKNLKKTFIKDLIYLIDNIIKILFPTFFINISNIKKIKIEYINTKFYTSYLSYLKYKSIKKIINGKVLYYLDYFDYLDKRKITISKLSNIYSIYKAVIYHFFILENINFYISDTKIISSVVNINNYKLKLLVYRNNSLIFKD